jgi:SAM-dependent methyltransferase
MRRMFVPTAGTRGRSPWFVDAFRAEYLDVYAHRDAAAAAREAKAALGLLRFDPASGLLLDLASGAGRHAAAFRTRRCRVVCLDLSEELTRRSRQARLTTVRGDMRALPFGDWSFRAVVCLFSSFGYFDDDAEHELTLREIARVLEPGGGVLLDLMDRDTVRYRLRPQDVELVDEMTIEIERFLSPDGRRVEKSIRIMRSDTAPRAWVESVRLFTAAEIELLATRAGLDVERTAGDYDGRPVVPGETRRLVVLRKPRR